MNGSSNGVIFLHLRAARQLILAAHPTTTAPMSISTRNGLLQGLVMELYAYLTLVSIITPYGLSSTRCIPLDPFVTSLSFLGTAETYGCVLGCGHDVFEYIPAVAAFARIRPEEGTVRQLASSKSKRKYHALRDRIKELRRSDPPILEEAEEHALARLTRDMYCGALRMFLETAMCGPVVDDPTALQVIQYYVDEYMTKDDIVSATGWGTISVWPCMIAGSCATQKQQQDEFCHDFWNTARWRINQVLTAERILKILWASNDKRMFGPYGLYLVMEQHGIDMPMA